MLKNNWWKEAVVYQIYPRSFYDSNGDGVGDIQGIIKKLDYLEQLGINVIWLSPVYQSPNDDNGYDISNYQDIMSEFGTMKDMENLINEAKLRNIQILMDLVVNHTSDEHPWFIEAKKSKDNPYRDYYIWREPASDGGVPNGLTSTFSGTAWEYSEETEQYYLHLFSKKQPDLNWENPKLRQEVYDMMNFWIDKGIGGFRMDVIDLVGKIPDEEITDNGPYLHSYIQEMNRSTFGGKNLLTVGETWGATPENAPLYSDENRKELSMIFQFEHVGLDQQIGKDKWDLKPLNVRELKEVLYKWQTELPSNAWNSLFWNNHDLPRIISRWGNANDYRTESGKMFAILLHMMKGTPYIYQGEEIGMLNTPITDIKQADDIETVNMFHERLEKGFSETDILESINAKGRDNARRPLAWSAEDNGGFTTGKPWLKLNDNYKEINIESALEDKNSIFYTYQQMIRFRKEEDILVYGEFLPFELNEKVFSFERKYKGESWKVIANFSEDSIIISHTDNIIASEILISNYDISDRELTNYELKPYETFVYKEK